MLNLSKKLLALSLVAGLACVMVSGCGGSKEATKKKSKESKTTDITLFYPVNIGGSAANLVDAMVSDFNKQNPDVVVNAVYTGNYNDTTIALDKAKRTKKMPELFISLSAHRYDLTRKDMITSLDSFIAKDPDGKAYINDFLEGFMLDSRLDGKVVGIPFQRSTEVVYYNKDMFRKAGLDPENPPKTWEEMTSAASALTIGGTYGMGLALNRSSVQWTFTGFALENSTEGQNLMNEDGKKVYFNTPENVEALQYWIDLQNKYNCMEKGIIQWTDLPVNFVNGKVAMIYHTTGNVENIRKKAKFDFGVFFMPGNKRQAAPTGGGNLYMAKGLSEKKQDAAWRFIRYCTDTNRAAAWSLNTGYVPVRKSCFETKEIKDYYDKVPQARVAYEQLVQSHCGPELSTYYLEEVWDALDQPIEEAMQGKLTAEEAMQRAQESATKILKDVK